VTVITGNAIVVDIILQLWTSSIKKYNRTAFEKNAVIQTMKKNIFLELELFLDPPIDTMGAMKEHLEKEKTPDWNKRINNEPKYKTFVAKAKSYIADECPSLEQQGKEARAEKYAELESQAKTIITSGATERKVKNLVNDFIKFFREDTIKKLVPLESSYSNQSEDEFVMPTCPDSLKCDKPVSFADMVKMSDDLREIGKKDLYDLLGISQSNESEIPQKVKDLEKRVRDTSSTDYKKDVLNRLHGRCALYFKDKNHQKGYDVARKRYRFDEFANKTLKHYVDGWIEKKKLLPAGVQQNALFTPAAFHLRDLFWTERETIIGKIVDFEFLSGATKGRMGRIFRLREDIVPSASLGL